MKIDCRLFVVVSVAERCVDHVVGEGYARQMKEWVSRMLSGEFGIQDLVEIGQEHEARRGLCKDPAPFIVLRALEAAGECVLSHRVSGDWQYKAGEVLEEVAKLHAYLNASQRDGSYGEQLIRGKREINRLYLESGVW